MQADFNSIYVKLSLDQLLFFCCFAMRQLQFKAKKIRSCSFILFFFALLTCVDHFVVAFKNIYVSRQCSILAWFSGNLA